MLSLAHAMHGLHRTRTHAERDACCPAGEVSSLSIEPHEGAEIVVSLFEVPATPASVQVRAHACTHSRARARARALRCTYGFFSACDGHRP